MERSNSMKGKRKLDLSQADDEEEDQPPAAKKRPTFASVILEASKMDHLLKLLDPLIRRMVGEAVELAFSKFCLADVTGRCSTKQIEGPYQRNLQLHFRSRLSLPLFTERKVEGEQGATINVALLDATTGSVVTSGLESSVKLDVVVLKGDFNNEDDENWTMVEFESHVVKEREGKRPLLIGDLQVTLKEGVGTLGDLTFTDNSSWTRSKKFRIGLKVASGRYEGIRIREAKTDAFSVKHHRAVAKKHCPPALDDEVFRLKKIGKDGKFHKRLQEAGICTVKDFLLLLERNPNSLKHILGKGMSNKIWEVLVGHSKTCILNGNYPADSLSYGLMVDADGLVKKAYDNRVNITQYDGNKIINLNQPNTDFRRTPDGTFNAHVSPLCFPVPIIPEQPTMEAGLPPGGTSCNENQSLRNDSIVGLALGSSHSSISGFHNDFPSNLPTNSTSNDKWSAIREVGVGLNHDTMSQSCCTVSEGLPSYLDVTVNGYSVSLGVPSQQNCSQGQLRSSRKGVPNWLKLKAVIMWGICVRNEAAAKKEEWESWMAELSFPDGFT